MALNPSDFALVIGINDYPIFKVPLKGAQKDAQSFADWLVNTDTGGGLPSENIAVLLSHVQEDGLARPVHEEIDMKLYELINRAFTNRGTVAPRRFYLYFSGHGLGLTSEDVGLCLPFWSNAWYTYAALKLSGYLDFLQKLGYFPEIFVFADCCRTALQTAGAHDPNLSIGKPFSDAADSRHLIAFATTYTNAAYESEAPTEMSNAEADESRGYFTTTLLEGLNGACARPEGGVSLDKLIPYLEVRVSQVAAQSGKTQKAYCNPTFRYTDFPNIVLGTAKPPVPPASPESEFEVFVPRGLSDAVLKIRKPAGTEDVELTLYGPDNTKIYQGFDPFSQELAAGTYLLRLQLSGLIKDISIEHKFEDTSYTVEAPAAYSPILIQNAVTSHEYYTDPAMQWSREMTDKQPLNGSNEGGIFIFARFLKQEAAKEMNFFDDLILLDENLKAVCRFSPDLIREDRGLGWFAFSAEAKPGQYYLRYNCHPARLLPVYCFPDWQTQVFLLIKDRMPVFETIRILTARKNNGFVPNNWVTLADTAFVHLQNPDLVLPPSVHRAILDGKFENPMLGILGAYLLLQRPKSELFSLLPIVLQNLDWLLNTPESPDLRALKILAGADAEPDAVFGHPPMLAFGSEGMIRKEMEGKIQIAPRSVFDKMISTRKADLVLTSWCYAGKIKPPA